MGIEKPPRELFKFNSIERQGAIDSPDLMEPTEIKGYKLIGLEYSREGIYTIVEGADFKQKGYAHPETSWTMNIAKKNVIEAVKLITIPEFTPALITFLIVPYKRKIKIIEKILESYNRMTWGVISSHILKEYYRMKSMLELERIIKDFLVNIGISKEISERFALILSHIIEYDNAYRFRLQDLTGEAKTSELIKNPRKEIKRLSNLFLQRDIDTNLKEKFTKVVSLASLIFLVPTIKKAFINSIKNNDISKLYPDDEDRYWICHREDYNFFGMTTEERRKLLENNGFTFLEGKTYTL